MPPSAEEIACTPIPIRRDRFNPRAVIPYGLDINAIYQAMVEFTNFLGFINTQLNSKGIPRFESMLMPANFSSIVGEFVIATIPKYCKTLSKNGYHNGHPDLLPKGLYPGNSVQHEREGIEVKASRYLRGWQGHNAEDCWLMVLCFTASRGSDVAKGIPPQPFAFKRVYLGKLFKSDWVFSGRKEGSRRTITASVTQSGYEKMVRNWIYSDDEVAAGEEAPETPEEASE
jgi:hypothetical protein